MGHYPWCPPAACAGKIGDLNKRSAGVQTTSAFNRRLFRYLGATSYGRPHWHKRSVYGGYADLSRGPPVVRVAGGGTTIHEIVVVLVGRCGTMTSTHDVVPHVARIAAEGRRQTRSPRRRLDGRYGTSRSAAGHTSPELEITSSPGPPLGCRRGTRVSGDCAAPRTLPTSLSIVSYRTFDWLPSGRQSCRLPHSGRR